MDHKDISKLNRDKLKKDLDAASIAILDKYGLTYTISAISPTPFGSSKYEIILKKK